MPKIKILPDDIANRIAAGEVVDRPSSVVKELIENSLDAGATRIAVEIEEGGRKLIRVTDNGEGMVPEDAMACFGRHATSKLYTPDDLFSIKTLGFRGEAQLPGNDGVDRLRRQAQLFEFGAGGAENRFGGTEALQKFGSGARSDTGSHIELNPISDHVRISFSELLLQVFH